MLRSQTYGSSYLSMTLLVLVALVTFIPSSCTSKVKQAQKDWEKLPPAQMRVAKLGNQPESELNAISEVFAARNPGYELYYEHSVLDVKAQDYQQVLFVQEGSPNIELSSGERSPTSVGEIILLAPGISLKADSAISVLRFRVPAGPAENVPPIIRPDWDPNITDTPGGCATDSNAYRRILLTWKESVGPYIFHALNAHRVRITDSFSHYHPINGGFDEFYLVQMVQPDARILTSGYVPDIEKGEKIDPKILPSLIQTTPLEVGDLVYLPRGIMHRGLGGVLAQVITVPGFVPGAEIGLDHHLKAINKSFGLYKLDSLPYNLEASHKPIIK